jgi:hypothetical protein
MSREEFDIDEEFELIVDKPKSTKGKVYAIHKIVKEKGFDIEYWYYNDHNRLQTLYTGQYNVIKNK